MSQTRHCNMGDHEVDIQKFYTRGKNKDGTVKYQSGCIDCNKAYRKQHYKDNKKYYVDKAVKRNSKVKAVFQEAINKLKSVPCIDCGNSFPPVCMDFDHLSDKDFNISQGWYKNPELIEKEISKCEIVCSNCHRIRTSERYALVAQSG